MRGQGTALALPQRTPWAGLAAALVAGLLLILSGNLAANHIALSDAAHPVIAGWSEGSLAQVLLVWIAGWFSPLLDRATALVLLYTGLAAGAAAVLFHHLRLNAWPAWQAGLAIVFVLVHPVVLQAVTLARPELLSAFAAALFIPACRRLEAIGDVLATVSFGLSLVALMLSGPLMALMIPLLALIMPFSDIEARRDPRIFLALMLVTTGPVLIVIAGVSAMWLRAGLGFDQLILPFQVGLAVTPADNTPVLIALCGIPVALVVARKMLLSDRRYKVRTGIAVLVLPIYLVLADLFLNLDFPDWAPALIWLGATLGWLATTRIHPWSRLLVLTLLALGSLIAWATVSVWAVPGWSNGLLPFRFFGLSVF